MAWAVVWDRVARAARVEAAPTASLKAVRARAWLMAGAAATALFLEAVVKEDRDMDVAGIMIAAATALFLEVMVKDTGVVRHMVETETITAMVRNTVMVTPAARDINEAERDMDAVDRAMVKAARAIAVVATSDKIRTSPSVPLA
jgi:hypothetical protein